MTGRERVRAAIRFCPPDIIPVQYYYSPVGYYEHGDKLNDLYSRLEGDFEPFSRVPLPAPAPHEYDADGRYHAYRRDEWGAVWEHRIFGIAGIPIEFPLADISALDTYTFPRPPALQGEALEHFRANVRSHQQRYYYLHYAGSLFERLRTLRPEEDLLCDIALDERHIHLIADKIMEYNAALVQTAVSAGADGISFGDDYGAQRGPVFSPAAWRGFFKPRLRELFAPAVRAGLDIHFHSCGLIDVILEDLREIGVTSIWPQLPVYDMEQLARRCRSLGLAVAIHTDRARTMTFATPADVRRLVEREYEVFRMWEGGSWFYIEADNGFPFENIRALVDTISELRGG